jgi:uncharacterized protein
VIRATLDVNVLASGFLAKQAAPAIIVQQWSIGAFELILSEHILDGVARAWQKPYFQRQFLPEHVAHSLDLLRREAFPVVPASSPRGVAEDEEDDLVLATAVAGSADFLVTGDRRLQSLATFTVTAMVQRGRDHEIAIVSPRQFADTLGLDL